MELDDEDELLPEELLLEELLLDDDELLLPHSHSVEYAGGFGDSGSISHQSN